MKMNFRQSIYLIPFSLFTAVQLQAQEVKPPEKVISEEIEVIRPYKPVLAEAVKLRRSPDLDNVKTYKARPQYTLTDRKLELNTDIQKLQAQQLASERQAQLMNNYVKGGVGNLGTLLAEAYVGMDRDQALQTAAFFRHFSQEGKLNKQNENRQQLSLYGRSIGDKATLNGRLNYQRHGLFFYGIDEENPQLNPDPERQVFNLIELEGEAIKRFSEANDAFSYAAKANVYFFSDKFQAKENMLSLQGYLNKKMDLFNLGVAAAAEIGKTRNSLNSYSNHLIRLNPYIALKAKGVDITAGIQFVQEFGEASKSRIYPAITADFALIPDFLHVFGELKGDVKRNTLRDFAADNPFLDQHIHLQNTVEKLSVTGGIKGTGGPGFGYKAKIYSKQIVDMPLYVNSFTSFNKFDVLYDFGTTNLFGLEGELSVQVSDNLKWTGKLTIEDYKPASEVKSYYKPQLRIQSNLLYHIDKKWSINASLYAQDDVKAKVYIANPLVHGFYPALPDETGEHMVNVKGFMELGAGAQYKINNKFGAFVQANNLLNTKYSRFLHYQMYGMNVYGGISYSF